jgi:DNA-binding transcriptional regulator YhcF (GntR family)
MERIQQDIIAGRYKPGDKLPSVRELALDAAVNPNTMQKALAELERSGLVYTQRTSGRFISEDTTMLKELKRDMAKQHVQTYFENMKQLGFSEDEALELLRDSIKGTGDGAETTGKKEGV